MPRLLKDFSPSIKVKLEGQSGDQKIAGVEGKDAEEFEPYLDTTKFSRDMNQPLPSDLPEPVKAGTLAMTS
jgi:hypothetical protein